MSDGIFKPNPQIAVAAGIVERIVPEYDIKQSDPIVAAESGIGNCVSKAVLGAIMLERAEFIGPKPSIAWNRNTHPKLSGDLFGREKEMNGHAQLLTADRHLPPRIAALSFNPDSTASSNWEIYEFNEGEEYAKVEDDKIIATSVGKAAGFVIAGWYQSGKEYQEALGQVESSFHKLPENELRQRVVDLLVARDAISSFVDIE